jgi:Coenzyme PQQ synthesis protein D (PqqD)
MSSEKSAKVKVSLESVYRPSEDIVSRSIEGELIIVPLVAGIGDLEDELYTLNETGKAIWDRLDGKKKLKDVLVELSSEFEAPAGEIEKDLTGLVEELVRRRILVAVA